jgi:hypothetical protein
MGRAQTWAGRLKLANPMRRNSLVISTWYVLKYGCVSRYMTIGTTGVVEAV